MTVPAADNLRRDELIFDANLPPRVRADMLHAATLLEAIAARHKPQGFLYPQEDVPCCEACQVPWPCPEHLMLHPEVSL